MPCKTCVHWNTDENSGASGGVAEINVCKNVLMLWDASEWNEDDESDNSERRIKPEYAQHKMFANDGSGYKAWFLTRENFHCSEQ